MSKSSAVEKLIVHPKAMKISTAIIIVYDTE
jgi:hypothetical protein